VIERRAFIGTLAVGFLAAPFAAAAQQAGRVYRIVYLGNSSPTLEADLVDAFRQGLRNLDYLEGKNIVIDYRWAEDGTMGFQRWLLKRSVSRQMSS
jgi:putative ABC transport system substrate-binding protein